MRMDSYTRRHGKLLCTISIPVDQDMKHFAEMAKKVGDFNAWVRDLILENMKSFTPLHNPTKKEAS